MMTTETRAAKALRLQPQVVRLSPDVAQVRGDHGVYVVDRLTGTWRCNCPWGRDRRSTSMPCSHALAAAAQVAPPAPSAPASAPAPAASVATPARRQLAEQAHGQCVCANVLQGELYFNRSQCRMIHRRCGQPFAGTPAAGTPAAVPAAAVPAAALAPSASRRKSPIRFYPAPAAAGPATGSAGPALLDVDTLLERCAL